MSLVEVSHPSISVDLIYATADNFTGKVLYTTPEQCKATLDEVAAQALYRAADMAEQIGLRIKVYDAYRPVSIQWKLWEIRPDQEFVTDPKLGSDHSRGTAVDLTLMDAAGDELDFGTSFDDASKLSHHGRTDLPVEAQRNRATLLGLMTAAGFELNWFEWWHYSLPNSHLYPLKNETSS